MEDFLAKEIVALIKNKPFYAHFLQNMKRIITEEVPTMGVNITEQINLYINPKFFYAQKPIERVALLEHEVLHIINKHCIRMKKLNKQAYNIASDIAINQFIRESYDKAGNVYSKIPNTALQPETFNFPLNESAEIYYKRIMKDKNFQKILQQSGDSQKGKGKKQSKGQGKGNGNIKTIDEHSLWEQGNTNEDYQHQVIKNNIKKTMEKIKTYGNLPSCILEEIKKAIKHETLNWRTILHQFLYRATIVNTLPTRKKPNRRYGFYYDGTKVECKLDMLIAIDTSGSITDKDLSLFFSEIERIKALGMRIMVVECDTEIHKSYIYKNKPKVVCGRGGTDFKPVFTFANKLRPRPNCIIYLTDLYADLSFKNISRIPTLWAITIDGEDKDKIPFGIGVKLKDDEE